MKKRVTVARILSGPAIAALAALIPFSAQAQAPINPCLECHAQETPKIVQQWEAGKHSKTGVKCYVCHHADTGDKQGMEHNDFFIVTRVDVATCESCHPENAAELRARFSKKSGNHP
ncbi:MAG: hypothetical protein Kow0089_22760 [Desulfobulbaceae bacterium]